MLRANLPRLLAVPVTKFSCNLHASDFILRPPQCDLNGLISSTMICRQLPEVGECVKLLADTDTIPTKRAAGIASIERAFDIVKNMPASQAITTELRTLTLCKGELVSSFPRGGSGSSKSLREMLNECASGITVEENAELSESTVLELLKDDLGGKYKDTVGSKSLGSVLAIHSLICSYLEGVSRLKMRCTRGSSDDKLKSSDVVAKVNLVEKLSEEAWKLCIDENKEQLPESRRRDLAILAKRFYRTTAQSKILRGLSYFILDGDALQSQEHLRDAASWVDLNEFSSPVFDPIEELNNINTERGIIRLLQAEFLERDSFESVKRNQPGDTIDKNIDDAYVEVMSFFEEHVVPASEGGAAGDELIDMGGNVELRLLYATALLARSWYLMRLPRTKAEDSYFPGTLFSMSPILNLPAKTPISNSSYQPNWEAFPVGTAKRRSQLYMERALKINRKIFAEERNNLQAGQILYNLACVYAELKDYLYATGLFNSAQKIFEVQYGSDSPELVTLLRNMEKFQRKIGSIQEAEATLHKIEKIVSGIQSL